MFVFLVNKGIHDPFFCGQPVEEFQIGFAVLHAEFPLGTGAFNAVDIVVDFHLFHQDGEDFRHG
ncbi:hypothetical protein VIAE108258_22095 [Vibrio aerogenes]